MPEEWWLSRLCEEFNCLPSDALREVMRAPFGLLERIIESRAYAYMKRQWENAETAEAVQRLGDTELLRLVQTIEAELIQESSD